MILSTQTHMTAARFGDEIAIRMLAAAGFDALDFTMFEAYNEEQLFESRAYKQYAMELRDIATGCGIAFNQAHAPFPSYRVGDAAYNKKTYPRLHRSIEICGILGVKTVIVHPVYLGENKKEFNFDLYNGLLPTAKAVGVKIAIENMWGHDSRRGYIVPNVCSTPDELCEYIDTLDREWFTVCLDLGHCNLVGEDEANFIRKLGHERLTSLHVHDTDFRNDLHTLPFMGKMDWSAIASALRDIAYTGDLTLEADNFLQNVPSGFHITALRYMHDTGRYLISMIEGLR